MVSLDGICPGIPIASIVELMAMFIWKVQTLKAFIKLPIPLWIAFLSLMIGISYMASTGARISLQGIAILFTTTGICGSGTPAGTEYG